MKRYLLIIVGLCLLCPTTAAAQRRGLLQDVIRDVGSQLIQQQFQDRQRIQDSFLPQEKPRYSGQSMPSEGGGGSGGDRQDFLPDFGYQLQPEGSQPSPTPIYQPQPQPVYRPQPTPYPDLNRPIYREGQPQNQPTGNFQLGTPVQPNLSYSSNDEMPRNPVMTNQYVVIRCPESVNGVFSYTLSSNGRSMRFNMSPGQEQRFRVGSAWTIAFNDGAQQKRYYIRGGKTYTMKRDTNNVWKFFSVKTPGA